MGKDMVRNTGDVLNYPGFTPDMYPPAAATRKRMPRPRNLAPIGLDFDFASSVGADPYVMWKDQIRRGHGDFLKGREEAGPFGGALPEPLSIPPEKPKDDSLLGAAA